MYEKSRHKVMNEHQREACLRGEGIADEASRATKGDCPLLPHLKSEGGALPLPQTLHARPLQGIRPSHTLE